MATYYRWDESNITAVEVSLGNRSSLNIGPTAYVEATSKKPELKYQSDNNLAVYMWDYNDRDYEHVYAADSGSGGVVSLTPKYCGNSYYLMNKTSSNQVNVDTEKNGQDCIISVVGGGNVPCYKTEVGPGALQRRVFSLKSNTYPTNGKSGSYWYDNYTVLTSPTNPKQLTYPSEIHSLLVNVSWQASISNTNYPVSRYELSYSTNGGSSWQVAGTTTKTTYQFGISSPEVTQIQFRVRAMDTNSQYSDYVTGSNSTVQYVPANPPVLVLPDNAKLGDTITISWNSVTDATNYILQRKVDGGEWTQIYSGAELSTTNLVDNLGISYRIAFNVGSNFTSEWSQEYRLNSFEKLIEMTYLGEDGNYMPLYPRTISNAVVNVSDLINTVSLSGTYQGNGIESNTVLLNIKEGIEPKIAFVSNAEGNVEIVNNFDSKGNLVVDNNSNVAGEEYSYIVIGKKED